MFTRTPTYRPGRRRPLALVLIVGLGVYLALTAAGTLWTDYLWFDSMGQGRVWTKSWTWSLMLGASGVVVAGLVFWLSLVAVEKLSPRWIPFDIGPEEEMVERFRDWIGPRAERVRILVSIALGLLLGLAASTWRDQVFLFINRQAFGVADPVFGWDVGFYVFQLPLWTQMVDWLFNLMVMTTVLIAVAHYLGGGIRFDGRRLSATRGAKIHLSVMFALIALVRAVTYRLDRFEVLLSPGGESGFFGAQYADIHARLPVLNLLFLIALIAAVLFIVNIWRRGWTLAGVSIAAWMVISIGAGSIYPALIQRFEVLPNQLPREMPYLENNLEATRNAYMLDRIDVRQFEASPNLTIDDIENNQLTIDNLRIWTTSVLLRTFQNFQELEPFYVIGHVDTDRYLDDGAPRQVMIGVRELDEVELPRTDWQNTRLFYTHGYGAVVNQANAVQPDGQPRFLLRDIPPVAAVPVLDLDRPQIYFGETYDPGRPVVVRTGAFPQEISGTGLHEFDGDAGVEISSFWRRLAFAVRYRDINLLISGEIRRDSRVLVERNVRAIVDQIAPFLTSDADPYPVILDGEVLWVLDMYTTTDHYPYSEPVTELARLRLPVGSAMSSGTNYIRNSVKAVISADNGDITFYVADVSDPIIRAWTRTYPTLFTPIEQLPEGLVGHLRYPQDLFRLQSYLYLEYHVAHPVDLFTGNDAWSFPDDPSTPDQRIGDARIRADLPQMGDNPVRRQFLPYYLLTELPGDEDLSYLLLQPFNPRARQNMVGFLVADSTPGRYGRLIDYRMPPGRLVDGAGQIGRRIEQDGDIAQQLTLWQGAGATVIKGDLLVVPIEDSVVYFQPIYLEESGGAFPEFRRVVVVYGDRIEWAASLDRALELVFGAGSGPTDPDPSEGDLNSLIAEAVFAINNAQGALARGDLAEYQRWNEEAARIIREIEELLAQDPEGAASMPGWVLRPPMS